MAKSLGWDFFSSRFMLTVLAQNTSAGQAQFPILGWLIVLVLAGVVLAVLALWLRKWLGPGAQDSSPAGGNGFSLAQLRHLYEQGELSQDEFESTKKLIIARSQAAMDHDDSGD